jgi:hypothetical protein
LLLVTKQAEESLKGLKNIKYHLPFNAPDSSSTEPASPAESDSAAASAAAPDSAAPPNLHLYCAEKVTFLACILIDTLRVPVSKFLGAVEISIFLIFQNKMAY